MRLGVVMPRGLVALAVCAGVGWAAARALEVRMPLDHAGAIVIMAGSREYMERAAGAAALFGAGHARRIVVTDEGTRAGWSEGERDNPPFVQLTLRALARHGVARDSVTVLPTPRGWHGTYGEVQGLRAWSRASGVSSLLFVTSAYHTSRVAWTVRRVFGEDFRFGVEPVEVRRFHGRPWWLSLHGWRAIPSEYAKWAYYRVRFSG